MKLTKHELALFDLVKVSLWNKFPEIRYELLSEFDWETIYQLSGKQGIKGIVFEGISKLKKDLQPNENLMLTWAANMKLQEERCKRNTRALLQLKDKLAKREIRMLLLKGKSLAEFYPTPSYREYGDIDIYLFDKWKEGNVLLQEEGELIKEMEKHTTFRFYGVPVENHRTFINLIKESDIFSRQRRKAFKEVEQSLHDILSDEPSCFLQKHEVQIATPTFNFLFLLMHAGNHLGGEVVLRHLCDWVCFLTANHGLYNEQRLQKTLKQMNFLELCNLITDVAIQYLGMPTEYAPSFYKKGNRTNLQKKMIRSMFYCFPGANEVKKNTLWKKWKRFYSKQWKYDLLYKEYLPEHLVRTFYVWYSEKYNKIINN